MACGVENLEGSVRLTTECRETIHLPKNILIMNDWNDGGVVFAVAGEEPDGEYGFIWGDVADLHALSKGAGLPEGCERFRGFAEWIVDRVRFKRDTA